MIDYEVRGGIATIAWNMTERPMNMLNPASLDRFAALTRQAIDDPAVAGVIVTSHKKDFIAGADLTSILDVTEADALTERVRRLNAMFRSIERGGKPFVAAINGTALGGGYEIALVCHHRIAADDAKILIGLPEVSVGLLPGGGGTQRLSRLIGIRAALPLLLEGTRLSPQQACERGLVDAVVPTDSLIAAARAWLDQATPVQAVQPWDRPGYALPGGMPADRAGLEALALETTRLRSEAIATQLALQNILTAVDQGCRISFDAGIVIETRCFVACCLGPQAANMIRVFFMMGDAAKLTRRPAGVERHAYRRIGVLGAGMMGSGIAHVSAQAGLDVVLLDTTLEQAEKGKAHAEAQLDRQVRQGRIDAAQRDAVLARIRPTAAHAELAGCELVVEAVFEDRGVKAEAIGRTEAVLPETAILASNTSTLPITGLAEASARPARFIGLHFFSPVERMPLVEIILGRDTSEATLAEAMDYVRTIRKTPIVVRDSRGFYTSRVFATYLNEGYALLEEGVDPATIDAAGRYAGMPVGPLALSDELSIELAYKVEQQAKADLGAGYRQGALGRVAETMVKGLGRLGKKAGGGFYDYPADGERRAWPGLARHFPRAAEQPAPEHLAKRLLYVQSVETARCLEEGVLLSPEDADVGAILGWGFPSFHGGPLGLIQTVGLPAFIAECQALAQAQGDRFAPPPLLIAMAREGRTFYSR